MRVKWKTWSIITVAAASLFLVPIKSFADAAPGDVIVTLGQDLTENQKSQLLQEMGVDQNVQTVTVSNEEEHKYLGQYISNAQIGTRAISSSKITIEDAGKGLNVQTHNISWVTSAMYMNALSTAGVKDADIYVTAPFNVSGTAALTGILKAYESTEKIEIPEAKKQVANEEMVKTAQLGDQIGGQKAAELMTRVKEEIAKNPPKTDEDMRALIQRVAKDLGIQLTDQQLNDLVSLFDKMKHLNINWNQVQNQLQNVGDKVSNFLNKDQTKSFIQQIIDFISSIIDSIKHLLKQNG